MKGKQYPRQVRKGHELTADDLQEKELIDLAVQSVIEVMRPWIQANPARLLKSLTKQEAESMVYAALGRWIAERSKKEAAAEALNDPIDDIFGGG